MSTPLHVSREAKVCRNICQVTLGSPARFTAARRPPFTSLNRSPVLPDLGGRSPTRISSSAQRLVRWPSQITAAAAQSCPTPRDHCPRRHRNSSRPVSCHPETPDRVPVHLP